MYRAIGSFAVVVEIAHGAFGAYMNAIASGLVRRHTLLHYICYIISAEKLIERLCVEALK